MERPTHPDPVRVFVRAAPLVSEEEPALRLVVPAATVIVVPLDDQDAVAADGCLEVSVEQQLSYEDHPTVGAAGETRPASRRPSSLVDALDAFDGKNQFAFDGVFEDGASQAAVFEQLGRPLLQDCREGFNATLLVVGERASGKSHALFGTGGEPTAVRGDVFSGGDSTTPGCFGEQQVPFGGESASSSSTTDAELQTATSRREQGLSPQEGLGLLPRLARELFRMSEHHMKTKTVKNIRTSVGMELF